MTDANSRQVALQNLREFQEMSYFDVYALIRQKRFDEARTKYATVLESMGVQDFSAALDLKITTAHDVLLECMSAMAGSVAEPEKIRAVGFDLSAHVIYQDENGALNQGVEVSLFSQDVYDFSSASDEDLRNQCESSASDWQGNFIEINSLGLEGLGEIAQQFQIYAQNHGYHTGVLESESGVSIVDPLVIARHVAKLLLAIEYHRYMAEFVAEVEVPSEMIFIIGEHDEIEVPIVFYRVGQAEAVTEVPVALSLEEPTVETDQAPEVAHQELAQEETPAMYHQIDEEQPSPPVSIEVEEPMPALETEDVIEAEPSETIDAPQEQTEPEEPQQEDEITSSAKARLGLSLAPKTFGQRSNGIFGVQEDEQEAG